MQTKLGSIFIAFENCRSFNHKIAWTRWQQKTLANYMWQGRSDVDRSRSATQEFPTISQNFMELESLLPRSNDLATGSLPKLNECSP
jgi:hypothetical protein